MDYSPEVVRRFTAALEAPKAPEEPEAPEAPEGGPEGGRVVSAEAEDRTLNVWVRFRVEASRGMIRSVGYEVFGCPHTIAAAGWAAERLRGASAEVLGAFDARAAREALDVPAEKLGKLLRIEDALRACAAQLAEPARRTRSQGG